MNILTCTIVILASVVHADILKETGVQGGFVVHLGCGNGELTASLRASDAYQVHGLSTKDVTAARKHIKSQGLYGPVSVDTFDGKRLPYIDNLANLVVVEDQAGVSDDEILRVLAPRGVA